MATRKPARRSRAPLGFWSRCIDWFDRAPPGFWSQRVDWYVDTRPYSRRELAVDAVVNIGGGLFGLMACASFAAQSLRSFGDSPHIRWSLVAYALSLASMLVCSAVYNTFAWSRRTPLLRLLKLCDHAGILLLIVGTWTPLLASTGCHRALAVEWACAAVSFVHKLAYPAEVGPMQLACFVGIGCVPLLLWGHLRSALTDEAMRLGSWAGCIYIGGLLPFSWSRLEGHTILWHACVMLASVCAFQANRKVATHAARFAAGVT